MADKEGTQYLVILDITPCTTERVQEVVPPLRKLLERLSSEPIEPFFRAKSLELFGYFIRSKLNATQISAAIESPQRRDAWRRDDEEIEPFLSSQDHVAVLQVGPDHSTRSGFSRALTWIERH